MPWPKHLCLRPVEEDETAATDAMAGDTDGPFRFGDDAYRLFATY